MGKLAYCKSRLMLEMYFYFSFHSIQRPSMRDDDEMMVRSWLLELEEVKKKEK
jgi:hypothetical protein